MTTTDETLRSARELFETGDHEEAARICTGVLTAEPRCIDARHLLGLALVRGGKIEDARVQLEEAAAIDPARPTLLRDLARLLAETSRWSEAAECFRRAARLFGESPPLCSNLAHALRRTGDLEGAAAAWGRAVELAPGNASHRLAHAAALHRAGHFARGWAEYECRRELLTETVATDSPAWDGSPLDGRTILVHAEQGLGDQIQFVRYAPMVAERGGRVVVHCGASLVRLLRGCPGVDEVVARGTDPLPEHDVHVWSASLPRIFGTTEDSIPAPTAYLAADRGQTERCRRALAGFAGVRVGINWEGDRANVKGRHRAIPLAAFHPLGRMRGVHLFSLQQGEPADQLREVPADVRITSLETLVDGMWETAAFMEALDLVVTNDTSLAHLAGALGRPVWLVLHEDACWRWRDSGEASAWYPTMRLFRRGSGEEWAEVLLRVRDELEALRARAGRGRHWLPRSGRPSAPA